MENSTEQKATTIKRFIDTTVNVDVAATRSNVITSLTHGFINSLQPCLLACSKPLQVMSLTPFVKFINDGFAAYISLEDV
ncbi:hypothetical protein H5410_015796 [Solanum commersonii]|uniref:Uncharacterized protein n=1 Tax=Solanum commersonii TaxID=4109 RepID=A0A9J5ZVH2_SOLCO|nr:hypothetical protein H5410_015796 [Solanum commersonii]